MRLETTLDIHLSAICTRHQFTRTPEPVLAELRAIAHGRDDVIAASVGRWIGYYDHPDRRALVSALRAAFPESVAWAAVGEAQRAKPIHGTSGYLSPHDH